MTRENRQHIVKPGTTLQTPRKDRHEIILRFFLFSAAIGLAIGLFEAALLRTTPRAVSLLFPDVGYVIWFLAPLVDMIFFGLLGLALGWVGSRAQGVEALVAFELAVITTFMVLTLRWVHLTIGLHALSLQEEVLIPTAWFGVTFIACLLVLALGWKQLAENLERWVAVIFKPLAVTVATAVIVAVLGVVFFNFQMLYAGGSVEAQTPSASQAPNIILITLDTVRADHLSAYGYSRPTTPHLDRFARQGVLFENAIAAAPWTLASHSSMFTGLLPHQHGADWAVPLPSTLWTLAKILRSRGYETAGFVANSAYLDAGWGVAQGFETYRDGSAYLRHNLGETFVGNAVVQPLYQNVARYDLFYRQNARQMNERVLRWFRHRSRQPFFLFVNYFDAHDPYVTDTSYNSRFGELSPDLEQRLFIGSWNSGDPVSFSDAERAALIAGYDNCLAYLDEQVDKLLRTLAASPEWQNTIVIITSDHGEEFGEHGHYRHGFDLYREVLHVPLIIEGPGVPRDARIDQVVAARQLFATALDLAAGGKTGFNRSSLARFWNPGFKPGQFDGLALSELVPNHQEDRGVSVLSLTTVDWHYVYHSDSRQEFYRWKNDLQEQQDLSGAASEQQTMGSLHDELTELFRNSARPWRGAEYLLPLGRQGSFLRNVLFSPPPQPGDSGGSPEIGASQASFSPQSWTTSRPVRPEQELMESLPYH